MFTLRCDVYPDDVYPDDVYPEMSRYSRGAYVLCTYIGRVCTYIGVLTDLPRSITQTRCDISNLISAFKSNVGLAYCFKFDGAVAFKFEEK